MKIKICGMRDGMNIREAERLQPDMMGFICWEKSPRYVSRRPDYMPAVCRVGVFVNPSTDYVVSQVATLGLNRIQLHGNESPARCNELHAATGLPVIKAFAVSSEADIDACREYEELPSVDMFLFDTRCTTVGGSGEHFDWDILRRYTGSKPFLLSGGIGATDAGSILRFRHQQFAGIDLNSRFETAPAMKDISLLKKFINTIRYESHQ